MNGHRQAGATDARHRRAHDLHRRGYRLEIVLREDTFDSDNLGLVAFDNAINRIRDRSQPEVRRQVLIRAGHTDIHERGAPRRIDVDDAEAAARQARVDAHDAHQARATISTNMA